MVNIFIQNTLQKGRGERHKTKKDPENQGEGQNQLASRKGLGNALTGWTTKPTKVN